MALQGRMFWSVPGVGFSRFGWKETTLFASFAGSLDLEIHAPFIVNSGNKVYLFKVKRNLPRKMNEAAADFAFKAHSGWAALVVLGTRSGDLEVLERSRVELVEEEWAKQPYHAAEELK